MVSDRPLDMAVSAFSPGAQIVRDGLLHTAVGFAHYEVKGIDASPVDPLGPRCQLEPAVSAKTTLVTPQSEQCPVCGGALHLFNLYQPRGFRTSYQPRDYDDSTDTASHAGIPSLSAVDAAKIVPRSRRSPWRSYEQAQVLQVNDNRGAALSPQEAQRRICRGIRRRRLPLKTWKAHRLARISMPRRSASSHHRRTRR